MYAGRTDFRAVAAQQCLHALERIGINQRRLFAVVDFVFVAYFAGVDHVGQQAIEAGLGEGATAELATVVTSPLPSEVKTSDRTHTLCRKRTVPSRSSAPDGSGSP